MDALLGELGRIDRGAFLWVVHHRISLLNALLLTLTILGNGGLLWLAIGAVLAVARRLAPSGLLSLVLAVLLSQVASDEVLKPLLNRQRPFDAMPVIQVIGDRPANASLPSGHATKAFACAFVLARAVPAAGAIFWTLATAMAYSRVYLGVHYPLDVLAGALLGLGCGVMAVRGANRLSTSFVSKRGDRIDT